MKNERLRKILFSAMMSAVICVATLIIRIPSFLNGYINFGDIFVILSGWILGGWYGVISAFVGSGLADLIGGYPVFIPATIIIKSVMSYIAFHFTKRNTFDMTKLIFSAVLSEMIMILGYYIYSCILFGSLFTALYDVFPNCIQGMLSCVLSVVLYKILNKYNFLPMLIKKENNDG